MNLNDMIPRMYGRGFIIALLAVAWLGCGGGGPSKPGAAGDNTGNSTGASQSASDNNPADSVTPKPAPPDNAAGPKEQPHRNIQKLIDGLANSRPAEVWDALPPVFQKDVEKLIRDAAEMDEELHEKLFAVLKRAAAVGADKRDVIRAVLSSHIPPKTTNSFEATLLGQLDNVIGLVDALSKSGLADREWLRDPKVDVFVAGAGTRMMASGMKLAEAFGASGNSLSAMKGVTVKPINGVPGIVELSDGNHTSREPCVKHDGKWLPCDLVDKWPAIMAFCRVVIEPFERKSLKANPGRKVKIMALLIEVDQAMGAIAQAQSVVQLEAAWPQVTARMRWLAGRAPVPPGRLLKWSFGGNVAGAVRIEQSLRKLKAAIEQSLGQPDQVAASTDLPNDPERADEYWIYRGLNLIDARPGRNLARLNAVALGLRDGSVVKIRVQ